MQTAVVIATQKTETGLVIPKYFTFGSMGKELFKVEIEQAIKNLMGTSDLTIKDICYINEGSYNRFLQNQLKDYGLIQQEEE